MIAVSLYITHKLSIGMLPGRLFNSMFHLFIDTGPVYDYERAVIHKSVDKAK